jgi:hypothetical protein
MNPPLKVSVARRWIQGPYGSQSAAGLDGREEAIFHTVDQNDLSRESALKIKVIGDFICGQLGSKCKAAERDGPGLLTGE